MNSCSENKENDQMIFHSSTALPTEAEKYLSIGVESMSITIKDVAAKAGVSVATVSRVINSKGYISDQTNQKVKAAMIELNYKPNIAARTLQGKSTATIGIIVPSLENPLYSELFECIEKELYKRHFQTLLCTSNNQIQKEKNYLSLLEANRVEGIISSSHSKVLEEYKETALPIISFDRKISSKIPTVRGDNYAGGKMIALEIVKRHKKNVLILSGSKEDLSPGNDRIKGITQVLKEKRISFTTAALPFERAPIVKKELAKKAINMDTFDAIICTDDLTALIVCDLTKKLTTPPLVTGYDGSSFIRAYHPELVTIEQPIQEISELLVELLVQKVEHPLIELEAEYVLAVKLVGKSEFN